MDHITIFLSIHKSPWPFLGICHLLSAYTVSHKVQMKEHWNKNVWKPYSARTKIYLPPILQSIRCICNEIRLLLYLGNSIYASIHSNHNNPMQSKCCRHNNVHADHISPDTIGKMEAAVRHPNIVPVLARFSVPTVHHTSCFL